MKFAVINLEITAQIMLIYFIYLFMIVSSSWVVYVHVYPYVPM